MLWRRMFDGSSWPQNQAGFPELDIAVAHLCDVPGEQYNQLRDRYRDMARMLGFEGHIAWAEAMQ